MERISLDVKGMHCDNCVNTVADALKGVDGVKLARVSFDQERADVTYDPSRASVDQLKEAVKSAGYEVA